jgi:DNA-binding Lrp family transcriptional regulator
MKVNELDSKDRKLIHYLQQDGRDSLTDLGGNLNLSHVSVQKRLKKLFNKKQIKVAANISASNMELCYAIILAEVDSYNQLKKIKQKFQNCPRIIFFGTMSGAYNVISIVAAEDRNILQSVINVCSLRNEPGLRRSDVFIIDLPLKPEFVPFTIPIESDQELSSCGTNCGICDRFIEKNCCGCPNTKWYIFK